VNKRDLEDFAQALREKISNGRKKYFRVAACAKNRALESMIFVRK
jgi:hypothetical protein